jgi:hypothetical protein
MWIRRRVTGMTDDGISDQHAGDTKPLLPDRDMYPLYAQNTAKQMHLKRRKAKIQFVLITQNYAPVKCEWVDTGLGFFVVVGKENIGFLTVKQLPSDALIINQHYVE